MIAYFAPLTTSFVHALSHKLMYHHDEECVLFIHAPLYRTRKLLFLREELKKNSIFNDVIAEDLLCPRNIADNSPIEVVKQNVLDYFSSLFQKISYSPNEFSRIYVFNDNHGSDFTIYFNIMKIRYTWVQVTKNVIPSIHPVLNKGYTNVIKIYKSLTPYAQYADACFRSDSVIPVDFTDKPYTVWDMQKSLENINDNDMQKLYSCFGLDCFEMNYNQNQVNTLIIQNSYGLLKESITGLNWGKNETSVSLGFGNYTLTEIFSIMDEVSLDFYAPDTESIYLKAHINEILDPNMISDVYQDRAILLPNIYFQILERFLAERGIKFDNVIATASTAIDGMSKDIYSKEYILEYDFSKTWWFYISLYTVLLFAKKNGFNSIYSTASVVSQLQNLSNKMECDIKVSKFDPGNIVNTKDSVVIVDLCDNFDQEFAYEKMDQSNVVAFINDGLSNSFINSDKCEFFTPICIKKDRLGEPVCDILFRNETVWLYSSNSEIRRKARTFKFERTLKFLDMRIHTDGITLPDSVELFQKRANSYMVEKTNLCLIEAEKKIEYLKILIQNPNTLTTILRKTNDIEEYLNVLEVVKHNYIIFLAVRDTPGNCLSMSVIDKIKMLGFSDFTKQLWVMYVGMLGKGTVICNKKGEKPEDKVEFIHTDINSGRKFELRSQAWRNGNKAEILIDHMNYAVNVRGINIVVYDIESNTVIDSIGYDRHDPNGRFVRNIMLDQSPVVLPKERKF